MNAFSQTSQTKGFSPVWITMCVFNFKAAAWLNAFLQTSQTKGLLWPVWSLLCVLKAGPRVNVLPQTSQTKGFSPVRILSCIFKPLDWADTFSHTPQRVYDQHGSSGAPWSHKPPWMTFYMLHKQKAFDQSGSLCVSSSYKDWWTPFYTQHKQKGLCMGIPLIVCLQVTKTGKRLSTHITNKRLMRGDPLVSLQGSSLHEHISTCVIITKKGLMTHVHHFILLPLWQQFATHITEKLFVACVDPLVLFMAIGGGKHRKQWVSHQCGSFCVSSDYHPE